MNLAKRASVLIGIAALLAGYFAFMSGSVHDRERDTPESAKQEGKRNEIGAHHTVPTDSEGRFESGPMSPGLYSVSAFRPGGARAAAKEVKTGQELTLALQ